eukprot:m.81180 g.81180  ORF g.81180 m.81180 type:complete len:378 (-) comp25393_c0_seq2:1283-2416(-)
MALSMDEDDVDRILALEEEKAVQQLQEVRARMALRIRAREKNCSKRNMETNYKNIMTTIKDIGLYTQCNFDVEKFVKRLVEIALQNKGVPREQQKMENLYAGGQTQSGKSAFKAVLLVVGNHFEIPTIIVTKGVDESADLAVKLQRLLGSHQMKEYVRAQTRNTPLVLQDCFQHHGAVVSAHTARQTNKQKQELDAFLEEHSEKGKFFLVFDEADDFIRRSKDDAPIELEKAHERLLKMKPCCNLSVSATLMPVLIRDHGRDLNIRGRDFFLTNQSDAYHGLLDAVPMQENGKSIFLSHKALRAANLYIDENVVKLFAEAASYPENALLLDVSDPRVHSNGNIVEKATELRKHFPKCALLQRAQAIYRFAFLARTHG